MDEIPIGDWGSGPVAISGREHQPRAEGDRRPKESREGGGSEQRRGAGETGSPVRRETGGGAPPA